MRPILPAMRNVDEDLFSFLQSYGFSPEELNLAFYETESFRSIPGTTLRRYMNRIISSIDKEDRPALLKGIILGVAIRKLVESIEERPMTPEEEEIDLEIERLGLGR
ncbi:MAG TPA: hypothetical protein PLQ38_07500 [Methanothrix sp.]|nr:hypothetical protein [Methanothrix sp.]